jgi:hypothetical protein
LLSQEGGSSNQIACALEAGLYTQMHPEEVMNADMPSEILLVVSGSLIFVTLLLILVAALTQTAALP